MFLERQYRTNFNPIYFKSTAAMWMDTATHFYLKPRWISFSNQSFINYCITGNLKIDCKGIPNVVYAKYSTRFQTIFK